MLTKVFLVLFLETSYGPDISSDNFPRNPLSIQQVKAPIISKINPRKGPIRTKFLYLLNREHIQLRLTSHTLFRYFEN